MQKSWVGAWCELSSAWKFGGRCHGLFPARRGSGDSSEGAGALTAPGPTREGASFRRGGPRGLEARLQMPVRLVSWWADIWAGKRPRGSRHLVCSLVPHHIWPRRRAGVGKGRTAPTPVGAIPARSFRAGRAEAVLLYIPSPPCSLTLHPLSAMNLWSETFGAAIAQCCFVFLLRTAGSSAKYL